MSAAMTAAGSSIKQNKYGESLQKKSKARNAKNTANDFLKGENEEQEPKQAYDTQEEIEEEEEEAQDDLYELDENGIDNIGNMGSNGNSKIPQRRSIVEQTHDLRSLLNKIFALRGGWKVKNLAMDFSDGFLF